MNAQTRTTAEHLLAAHIRATMTPEESRFARDERYNVYLALELDDADVLFVIGSRALDSGATDIDAFTTGYTRAITGTSLDEHSPSDAFTKGYEAGRKSLSAPHNANESSLSSSTAS